MDVKFVRKVAGTVVVTGPVVQVGGAAGVTPPAGATGVGAALAAPTAVLRGGCFGWQHKARQEEEGTQQASAWACQRERHA